MSNAEAQCAQVRVSMTFSDIFDELLCFYYEKYLSFYKSVLAHDFSIKATLTIHSLTPLWTVCRDHILATFITLSLKEFPRISHLHPVHMPHIRMSTRNRK